jgi:hypothetical protein
MKNLSTPVSVTRLKNMGILTNNGEVVGLAHTLNMKERVAIIQRLRQVLSCSTAEDYLRVQSFTPIFPESVVYQIIRDNKSKLMNLTD